MSGFTEDLIAWIEDNLENPLLVDDVTQKAGYSKWYLQRRFKRETGIPLAKYIRDRRLCKAALLVRMSRLPMMEIAARYQFDSQQSFNRRFKQHFGVPPGEYRRAGDWRFTGIRPRHAFTDLSPRPVVSRVTLAQRLTRHGGRISHCRVDQLESLAFHYETRAPLFAAIDGMLATQPGPVWLAEQNVPESSAEISFTSCLCRPTAEGEPTLAASGDYLALPLTGTQEALSRAIMHFYLYEMTEHGHVRRDGHDLLRIDQTAEGVYQGCYFVPVA
ncbi:helix-turn-helix domain-containing protein [Nissabacter sp. SGAir0207]|uniref:helix-turn-helix domain-containing protein n=1 Tax=Nissabacter sp. SGAir0207 TaxID=2126321 RepID=UPI0010CCDDB1|nr:helix-turn-helix domain-containing protein [Nissabacter sp. SGAir0207]QCR35891.1 hypothetical protein C1N62_07240 [Nissabacter sp. SGAir0207]